MEDWGRRLLISVGALGAAALLRRRNKGFDAEALQAAGINLAASKYTAKKQ